VLLLHGGGQTRHSWHRSGPRFAEAGWTTIAIDARGHGDSDWAPDGDYSMDAFVGDLAAVVAELGVEPVLVGASLGGIASLLAVGESAVSARALVLVDVAPRTEPAGVQRIMDFMAAAPDGFATLEEVADAVSAYNPHRARPTSLDGLKKNVRQWADGRWHWHWDPAFLAVGDEPSRHTRHDRLKAAAERVEVPTMLVRGAQSDVVSPEGAAELQRLIPDAVVREAKAGHMVAGDDNDVFASQVVKFLSASGAERS
jgi:pimeloyl-ACP methyl ester carboxylesterase